MSPKKTLLLFGLACLGLSLTWLACQKPGDPVTGPDSLTTWKRDAIHLRVRTGQQPLAFDHEAHIKAEDMDCLDCHKFAEKGIYATLPKLKDCADCHSEAQGKHPDEPKVREYLDEEKEIPWVTVNKLPGHVYFSHRAHVGFAEMKCWDCHRDMRKVSQPVTETDIGHLSMSKCMACHEEKKVEDACTTCHK